MATALQDTLASEIEAMGRKARAAATALATAPRVLKDEALRAAAATLRRQESAVLAANERDVAAGRARQLTPALLDRLALDSKRIAGIARSLEAIAELGDPVGQEIARWQRPNGLDIARVRTPL
ncbi:MAG: gamma-glutamyl-phosphate reductase, partial [Geminicoccaceae bacterium]|nr:gamma-glutamyl-phosphate reductase [Geminicoccaceae bacterium]